MPWNTKKLRFAVREPFPSKASETKLVFGDTDNKTPLTIASLMPENGVIFSDGIETDYLEFNSGAKALISVAEREGRLII
jgi:hypothetical protein